MNRLDGGRGAEHEQSCIYKGRSQRGPAWTSMDQRNQEGGSIYNRCWDRKRCPFRAKALPASRISEHRSLFLFTSAESTKYVFLCCKRVWTQAAHAAGRHRTFVELFFFWKSLSLKLSSCHDEIMEAERTDMRQRQGRGHCRAVGEPVEKEYFQIQVKNLEGDCTIAPFIWGAKLIFGKRETLKSEHLIFLLSSCWLIRPLASSSTHIHTGWTVFAHVCLWAGKKRHY